MTMGGLVPVASLLAAASRRLSPRGELLQVSGFSLFEAMSAMEIGHEKMDPGAKMDFPGAKSDEPLKLLQEALEQLDGARLLRVLDHLLALEATHYSGGGLANTVYSSRFMMHIDG
jgi:hypothetical protein